MNVAAQERPKISVAVRKDISGSGRQRLRDGDSGRVKGRIWRYTVCAKDDRSADPLKRASRAKLVGGEEWPEWLQPRGSYAPLGSRSENCIGTGGPAATSPWRLS